MTAHRIVRSKDGLVIAEADGDKVRHIEGNWYFAPETVNTETLETSDRIYDCPIKGRCYWVDMVDNGRYKNNLSWIYFDTLPDYDHIRDWYGFYPHHDYYKHQQED